jgi:hypothetical protein
MLAMSTTIAVTLCVLAALARIVVTWRPSAPGARLADALLLLAGVAVLGSVAWPGAWTPAVLDATPLEDPRLAGAIALGATGLLALLASFSGTGLAAVSAVAPLATGAAAAATALFFIGLHGGLPLTAVALGGGTLGLALFVVPKLLRGAGPAGRAFLATGVALISIGAALGLCGARISAPDANEIGTGSVLTGPALIVRDPSPATTVRHPVVWLAKGDSVAVGEASLKFMKFRIEDHDGIHMYADIAVMHGGRSTTVSPAVHASAQGEEPIPVAVQGVGSILIAGMDADHGRVALLVPGAGEKRLAPADRFTLVRRPGLELAWVGLGFALLAMTPFPRKRAG